MLVAELVANCPRCRTTAITFDVTALVLVRKEFDWAHVYEAFGVCRNCSRSTTFVIRENTGHDTELFEKTSPLKVQGSLNNYFEVLEFISLKDQGAVASA
jgi:hypothetical protein